MQYILVYVKQSHLDMTVQLCVCVMWYLSISYHLSWIWWERKVRYESKLQNILGKEERDFNHSIFQQWEYCIPGGRKCSMKCQKTVQSMMFPGIMPWPDAPKSCLSLSQHIVSWWSSYIWFICIFDAYYISYC